MNREIATKRQRDRGKERIIEREIQLTSIERNGLVE